jgi:hypothetical protein
MLCRSVLRYKIVKWSFDQLEPKLGKDQQGGLCGRKLSSTQLDRVILLTVWSESARNRMYC